MNRTRKLTQRLALIGLALVLFLLVGQRVERMAHATAAWITEARLDNRHDGPRLRVTRRHFVPPVVANDGDNEQFDRWDDEEREFRVLPDSLTLPADLDPAIARRIRRAEERVRRAEQRIQEATERARAQRRTTRHE